MIEIDLPQSVAGIFLFVLVAFVLISLLITTGILPALLALVLGAAVLYAIYIVLMRIHRRFQEGRLIPRSTSSAGGDES